jgi:Fic-DOC domain mobile mystery protein B
VTDPLVPTGDGHTALTEQDRQGLIPTYIATRGDLFDAEQQNIASALLIRPPKLEELLDDKYLRDLHRRMFENVWRWAGHYRGRETNIGIAPSEIPVAVRQLVDDTQAWVDYRTYEMDELAVRFHHRLVAIHPFPNGNGRHGRVTADFLIRGLGGNAFSWGANLDVDTEQLRNAYRHALQRADANDISELIVFARH